MKYIYKFLYTIIINNFHVLIIIFTQERSHVLRELFFKSWKLYNKSYNYVYKIQCFNVVISLSNCSGLPSLYLVRPCSLLLRRFSLFATNKSFQSQESLALIIFTKKANYTKLFNNYYIYICQGIAIATELWVNKCLSIFMAGKK